ncbi:hypothetical protein GIB67_021756 [Kingdonia uniflora]|uniref:Uncharacterized protein n=1 Tax=Kingdonia uniflora TaxID=39325 RepID=A0A7J7M9W8_9MAGN|nr:hypothetical protein GIB67_021756 [Kingdonia uniflora]
MFRFSCFHVHIHQHKSKKGVERPANSVHSLPIMNESYDNPLDGSVGQVSSPDGATDFRPKVPLVKSQSLGSGLYREGRVSTYIDTEDEMDKYSSYDNFDDNSFAILERNSHDGVSLPNEYHHNQVAVSFQVDESKDNLMIKETIFSIGGREQPEGEGCEYSSAQLYGEDVGESENCTPCTPHMIVRSRSLPNPRISSTLHVDQESRCRSSEDLVVLNAKMKDLVNHEVGAHSVAHQEKDSNIYEIEEEKYESTFSDRFDFHNFNSQIPEIDEVELMKNLESRVSVRSWDKIPSKEFKVKRIEEWVNMIDLEQSNNFQDAGESLYSTNAVKKGPTVLGSATNVKLDAKSTHAMESAKKYIASLTASSASAQLTNLGLVVVPLLSAFVSLRVLNLSGNGIVRITAGALPRGLHTLNLAKNHISTIEGLRELTRLRVLDLSYNRLLRIGHGLGYCSSLKELYLAGNKISEVEGLHRLLKLKVLDLRFNKISTAKCLGLLAANLEAINLEGNPAQRNVGDEQLKKYLQGPLPKLVYYNKHPIRASSSKEVVDRPARSVTDRGLRSEHKLSRKGNHTGKASSSSHGHTVQAAGSPKRSKDRHHRQLPPTGTRGIRHNYLDLGSKLLDFRTDLSMRRSQSEGSLGAS